MVAAHARNARLLVSGLLLAAAFLAVAAGYWLNRRPARIDANAGRAFWHGQIVTDDLQASIAPSVATPDRPVGMQDLPADGRAAMQRAILHAMAVYPAGFLDRMFHRLVLAGQITMWNTPVGGFFVKDTIALNAHDIGSGGGEGFVADSFHHELSSIVRNQVLFNVSDLTASNPAGFAYLSFREYQAVLRERPPVDGDAALHAQGFVSRYGQTSLNNDWNIYAEHVSGHGKDFAREICGFARMRSKAAQLAGIYEKLEPASRGYFEANGLHGDGCS